MLLRDYDFSYAPVFTDDDITAAFPVVMHTNFKVSSVPLALLRRPLFQTLCHSLWSPLLSTIWPCPSSVVVSGVS